VTDQFWDIAARLRKEDPLHGNLFQQTWSDYLELNFYGSDRQRRQIERWNNMTRKDLNDYGRQLDSERESLHRNNVDR
jgi:hypothetical protein